MEASDLYWNIDRTLSYNCLFNFIIGMRGVGKTYGSLKWCIKHYKSTGKQFLYVRRIKTELEKLTIMHGGRLFNAVKREFPDDDLKAESNILSMNKEVIGYSQALSTASILKSDAFPDVDTIIFDEFIIDNSGTYHYLKDEVRKFFDLYETVARGRDVRVLFLSNAVSVTNPYFDFFHLNKPVNGDIQRFGKHKDILVENTVNTRLQAQKKQSRFGQIIEGSDYSDYAYSNEWLLDNEDFIANKPGNCRYYVSVRYKDTWLGVWFDDVNYRYYISLDVDQQCPYKYSATTDDHKPNIMLFSIGKKMAWIKELIDAYQLGCVWYESVKIKNWFRDIMRMANGC